MKRWLCVLLAALMAALAVAACAEDVFQADLSRTAEFTAEVDFLRVLFPLEGQQDVTLTVTDAFGGCVYQRVYPGWTGYFLSEDIYLPAGADYTVQLTTGGLFWSAVVHRPAAAW